MRNNESNAALAVLLFVLVMLIIAARNVADILNSDTPTTFTAILFSLIVVVIAIAIRWAGNIFGDVFSIFSVRTLVILSLMVIWQLWDNVRISMAINRMPQEALPFGSDPMMPFWTKGWFDICIELVLLALLFYPAFRNDKRY